MRSETIERFLEDLATGAATPSAGPGAALSAARGAALVAMVARRGGGVGDADVVARARDTCDGLRELALELAEADERASDDVVRARALPATTDAEQDARSEAVAGALTGAGHVATGVIDVADRALAVAEALRTVADSTVLGGIAAAAEALRAAVGTARVEVELTLAGIAEPSAREELLDALDPVDDLVLRAAKVTAAVREQIVR